MPMHSSSRTIILAAGDLSAPYKDRSDHSSISDKGEVSSNFTIVLFFVFRQGSSWKINGEKQVQTKNSTGNIYLLHRDAIILNVSIFITFLQKMESKGREVSISLVADIPI